MVWILQVVTGMQTISPSLLGVNYPWVHGRYKKDDGQLQKSWTLHDLWMFAFHLLFSYGSCAPLRVKMESIYIYSVFMWGRRSGLVECLSYWHTCCVSNGSTETQWRGLGGAACHSAPLCVYMPSACWFCHLLTLQCWWFFVIWAKEISDWKQNLRVLVKCSQVWINSWKQPACVLNSDIIHLHLTCLFFVLGGWIELWFQVYPHYCTVCAASNGF